VRVGDVLSLERLPVEPDLDREYVTVGIRSFGRGLFHYDPQLGDDLGSLRFFKLKPHRLVISNIKAWEGAVAVSGQDDRGCLGSNRFLSYAPVDDRIDVAWARWFFLSEAGLRLLQTASPGSADRNRTLAISRFEALEIPLPPIDEQRRVASRLDSISARRAELNSLSSLSDEMRQALGVSITSRPDLSETERRELGWTRVPLGSVITEADEAVAVEPSRLYPNLGIRSFGNGAFRKADIDGGATSARVLHRVHAGQFIYSRLFAFEGAYGQVTNEFEGHFVSNEFPTFDTDAKSIDVTWLVTHLRSPEHWRDLAANSKGLGVRRQRVPVEAVLAYHVWLPPMAQQRQMVGVLVGLGTARVARSAAEQKVEALLPAALNDAFLPAAGPA
jgi:type I restriction enzyme S subunit